MAKFAGVADTLFIPLEAGMIFLTLVLAFVLIRVFTKKYVK